MSSDDQTVPEHPQLVHELLAPVILSLLGLGVALLITAYLPTTVFG
jgi:hypothetical protein